MVVALFFDVVQDEDRGEQVGDSLRQQCSLASSFQPTRVAMAHSPTPRILARVWLTAFWLRDSGGRRTGRAAKAVDAALDSAAPTVKLSRREGVVAVLSWILGPLSFPQGVVPVVVLLGIVLLYQAIRLTINSALPAPAPRRT
jgi:hypothetical protein